jgi:hypothetical protein
MTKTFNKCGLGVVEWRSNATSRPAYKPYSAASDSLGLYDEKSVSIPVAMLVMGFTHRRQINRIIATGALDPAIATPPGKTRIKTQSLLNAGYPQQMITEAENRYTQNTKNKYQRRKARANLHRNNPSPLKNSPEKNDNHA